MPSSHTSRILKILIPKIIWGETSGEFTESRFLKYTHTHSTSMNYESTTQDKKLAFELQYIYCIYSCIKDNIFMQSNLIKVPGFIVHNWLVHVISKIAHCLPFYWHKHGEGKQYESTTNIIALQSNWIQI